LPLLALILQNEKNMVHFRDMFLIDLACLRKSVEEQLGRDLEEATTTLAMCPGADEDALLLHLI
jgi:hypothetical protein